MTKTTGYEIEVLFAYLAAIGVRRQDGQFATLNDERVNDSTRALFARWQAGREIIPLAKVDEILLKHGVMLWEFEHWTESNLGRTGFIDPYEEPKELVA